MPTQKITKLKNYQPSSWLIRHTDLTIFLEKSQTKIISKIAFYPNNSYCDELFLNGSNLALNTLKIDNIEIDFKPLLQKNGGIKLQELDNKPFTLETEVLIYPHDNLSLNGLYVSGDIYCTQCEAEGFRKITYFLDRPDILSTFKTTIIADKSDNPVLLSNGNLIKTENLSDNKHKAIWHDPIPKPCYLFAVVAGKLVANFDTFTTQSGNKIALNIYTEIHNQHLCDYAMQSLIQAMKWDERKYGREYDLEIFNIVAVDDFNSGAMENKGLNIFNSRYILADIKTATDTDFINIKAVVGHEYFHNWTGNRITCRDWFQLSLKEGLTVFREQQFMTDFYSKSVKRIKDVKLLKTFQFAEDKSPLSHPVRPESYIAINNFYTYTVYEKGAEIIRMFYNILGEKLWREAMDFYFDSFDGQAVTVEDLLSCFAKVSDTDLRQMKLWYTKKGTPELTANWVYDKKISGFHLSLSQRFLDNPDYQSLFIPVKISWISDESQSDGEILNFNEPSKTYHFSNIPKNATISLLQDFSAPVALMADYSIDEMLMLIEYDNDKFNRWQMLQTLFNRVLLDELPIEKLSDLLVKVIENPDEFWRSEMLALPSFENIVESLTTLDIDFLAEKYPLLMKNLAENLSDKILDLLQNSQSSNENLDSISMANRQFNHNILWILSFFDVKNSAKFCKEKYFSAKNMTDKISALKIALNIDNFDFNELLLDFYQTYQKDTLVIDKWFSLQASVLDGDVLQKVQNLTRHPDFNWKNPNRMRSLIYAFSQNLTHFHCVDGSGYRFVRNWILKIDKINPQVAARLAKCFAVVSKLTGIRQTKMQIEIQYLSTQKLSKNLSEIVGLFLKSMANPKL